MGTRGGSFKMNLEVEKGKKKKKKTRGLLQALTRMFLNYTPLKIKKA